MRQSERFDEYREAASGADGVEIRDGACWLRAPGLAPFVILRGDGRATYNWASAVDDLRDGISHVIRGNDHLSNTPLQQAAIRALRGEPPQYLHHAVITGETGKLSKREGASSITDLRLAGYPPEAVVNYLGLIGTSGPGDVLSMDELVDAVRRDADGARDAPARSRPPACALHQASRRASRRRSGRAGARALPARHTRRGGAGHGAGAARRPYPGRGGRAGRLRPGHARARGAARARPHPRPLPRAAGRGPGAGARRRAAPCAGAAAAGAAGADRP